jgi:hypothetical protein
LPVLGFKINWGEVKKEEEYHEEKSGLENPRGEKPYFLVPQGMGRVRRPY